MDVSNFVALLLSHGKRAVLYLLNIARGGVSRSSRLNQNSQDVTKIGASSGTFRRIRETKRLPCLPFRKFRKVIGANHCLTVLNVDCLASPRSPFDHAI